MLPPSLHLHRGAIPAHLLTEEALALYRETYRMLKEDSGIEPGRELRELQQAILREDPALAVPRPKRTLARVAPRPQPYAEAPPVRYPAPAPGS